MACGSGPRTTVRTLSSGRKIRVISIQRVEFNRPPPALVLRYQTDLRLDQKDKLQEEVSDIWSDFRKDVETADLKAAAIIAGEMPNGWPLYRFNTYGFVFEKAQDGNWTQRNLK